MEYGILNWLDTVSRTPAGLQGAKNNVPSYLWMSERHSIEQGRKCGLQGYNAYRQFFDLQPCKTFLELTGGDQDLAEKLAKHYQSVDDVEYFVGLRCEKKMEYGMVGEVQRQVILRGALALVRTHPLLYPDTLNADMLTDIGMEAISDISPETLVIRNTKKDRGSEKIATKEVIVQFHPFTHLELWKLYIWGVVPRKPKLQFAISIIFVLIVWFLGWILSLIW